MSESLYLAGKMTGLPNHGFELFAEAAAALRAAGHTVINPAELDGGDTSQSWAYYLRRDLAAMLNASPAVTGLALLHNWRDSDGAQLEYDVATRLGIRPYLVTSDFSLVPLRETVLEAAERVVQGPRRNDYGTPLYNHTTTAMLFQAYLRNRAPDLQLTAEDVCFFNVLQKIARTATTGRITPDTLIDLAGYTRNIELIQDERSSSAA